MQICHSAFPFKKVLMIRFSFVQQFRKMSLAGILKITFIACAFIVSIKVQSQSLNPLYNKVLADSLGADEYGMKMYVLVILKTGLTQISEKSEVDSLFAGHMQNITRLADEGLLVVAGPLSKNDKKYRGIFILNAKSLEEATVLLQTDPAVKAGLLDFELFQWYGSAALGMYLPFHDEVKLKGF